VVHFLICEEIIDQPGFSSCLVGLFCATTRVFGLTDLMAPLERVEHGTTTRCNFAMRFKLQLR